MSSANAKPFRPNRLWGRTYSSVYFWPVTAIPAGVVLATVAARVDNTILADIGVYPQFTTGNVRVLFASVAGATITVTAVIFWIRATLIQLASSRLSDRILRLYLEDRFQQGSNALLIGIFSYMAVSLLTLPADPALTAPFLSALLGLFLSLAALLTVIIAIATSVSSTQVPAVLSVITKRALDVTDRRLPEVGEGRSEGDVQPSPEEETWEVRAGNGGWIRLIDEESILAALPDGSTAWLDVGVGQFIYEGTRMARVSGVADGERAEIAARIRDTFQFGAMRSREQDLSFGIRELVDVGLAALSRSDTSTAFEAILRIGQVLRSVMLRDLPAIEVRRDGGGTLYRSTDLSHSDMVILAFEELRWAGAGYPNVVTGMLITMGKIVEEVEERGLSERTEPIRLQADLLVRAALWADIPEEDKQRVRDSARRHGLARTMSDDGSVDVERLDERVEEKSIPELRD